MRSMKRLTFLLSGEHPTVPASEAVAAIEAEGHDYKIDEELDQVSTLKTNMDPLKLAGRLGMCHWIGEHFCSSRTEDLMDSVGSSDLIEFLPQSESISVRVKRIKQYLPGIDTQELAEEIADKILEEYNYEIDLERPDNEIVVILTEGKCVLVAVRARIERAAFESRRPSRRAAVHPSTMQPSFARALVNLARTPRGGTFLDPFCGVGGILLEAGLVGAKPTGVDIDPELVKGARENLKEAGLEEFELRSGDARKLEIEEVDAIATDPPYGRQASTGGLELKELYEDVLPKLSKALKPGRYLCITSPSELNLEKMIEDYPLDLEEKHRQRVHKSLERNIYVFRGMEG